MNKKYKFNNSEYEIIKDYKEGFNREEVELKFTDYFDIYNYVVGDWAYGKLRLKGFYDKKNKNCKEINNIDNVDKYIIDNCAYDCRYFIIKKVSDDNGI